MRRELRIEERGGEWGKKNYVQVQIIYDEHNTYK